MLSLDVPRSNDWHLYTARIPRERAHVCVVVTIDGDSDAEGFRGLHEIEGQ